MSDEKDLRIHARQLRKNATKEEQALWYRFLRTHGLQFKRQEVIGGYIADFFCPKAGLVIEVDGGQHFESQGRAYDLERTRYLEEIRGLRVLRFSNLDVNENFEGVCTAIDQTLCNTAPSSVALRATASPKGKPVRRTFP